MLPEVYFLKYAFPCSRVSVDIRKNLSEEEWLKMKECVENDISMDRSYLEKTFPVAVARIKKINSDMWNVAVIREYFWSRHESEISSDLPLMIRRLCVVKKGKLIQQFGDVFKVDLGENDIRNVNVLYPNASVGDEVMVHYGYAVEKV